MLVATPALPAGVQPDPATVSVTVAEGDGEEARPLLATASLVDAAHAQTRRTVVLALDTSTSMTRHGRLTSAISAARQLLTRLPQDVQVGLVAFSSTTRVLATPTSPSRVLPLLESLPRGADTALHDAVVTACRMLSGPGAHYLVLLTDGQDTVHTVTRTQAISAIHGHDVHLTAISFSATGGEQRALRALATGAGGEIVVVSRTGELTRRFQDVAAGLAREVLVDVRLPASLAGHTVSLTVQMQVGSTVLHASRAYLVPVMAATAPTTSTLRPALLQGPAITANRMSLLVTLGVIFVALVLLIGAVLGVVTRAQAPGERMRRRLSIYSLSPEPGHAEAAAQTPSRFGDGSLARTAISVTDRLTSRRLDTAVARQLEVSGLPLRTAEWLLLHAGSAVGATVFLLLLTGGMPAGGLIGLVLGAAVPWVLLRARQGRRESAFLAQLPATLQLVAGSLRAGHSIPQAVDAVTREGEQPITTEFTRALMETRLGVSIEDALEGVAERMGSRDFAWVVMAIRIQRQVGGNLAELLTTVSETLRERERLRRQVKTLSAEGRISGLILGLMPVAFTGYLAMARPSYLAVLVTDPRGMIMVTIGLVLLIVGALWMRRLVVVEV